MKIYSIFISTRQIKAHLKAIPNWSQKAQAIYRTYYFDGFLNSIIFVNRIARKA
jgi:pterin-4a-carbinolamine dehydratase